MKTIKHCQTFSWKFTLAVLSFCIMQLISNGQSVQSRFWYTGDNIIDMSSYTTPVITPTNVSPSQFVSNGAYWTNGSINETEFFVSDNTVFQDDGLGGLTQSQMYSILNTGPNSSIISSEVGVCPKPGSECNTYYIIYSRKDQTGNTGPATLSSVGLYYVEYSTDLANGGIVVPETQLCTDCFLAIGGQGNCFDFFPASFAISPRLANGERYMYAVMTSANSSCFNINKGNRSTLDHEILTNVVYPIL